MSYNLRDYQDEAIAAVETAWESHRSALVVLPTGTGKGLIMAELARRNRYSRSLLVCPMTELIHQSAQKIREVTGVVPAIEQASNRSYESEWEEFRCPFIVASKQTLCQKQRNGPKRYEKFKGIGMVCVDEAHLSPTAPMIEMLDWFTGQGAVVVGFTATPNRLDKVSLGTVFETAPYCMSLPEAIQRGWLVSPVSSVVRIRNMDLSRVRMAGGDFQPLDLNRILSQERVELEIADVVARESVGLKTAVYCSSIAQAMKLAEILSVRYELKADFIAADTQLCTEEHRHELLESFKNESDGIQILTSVGTLTTGWDYPGLQHIVMARPTRSLSLFTQILGRGTRPLPGVVDFSGSTPETRRRAISWSGKKHFKVTDLVDCSLSHKIVTTIDALAGDLPEGLRERYVQEAVDKGPVDPLEKLEDARQAILAEEELEKFEEAAREARKRILAEAAKRKHIRGDATYDSTQVDLLDAGGIALAPQKQKPIKKGPVVLFGRYRGVPLADVPKPYLEWKVSNLQLAPWYRNLLCRELAKRK